MINYQKKMKNYSWKMKKKINYVGFNCDLKRYYYCCHCGVCGNNYAVDDDTCWKTIAVIVITVIVAIIVIVLNVLIVIVLNILVVANFKILPALRPAQSTLKEAKRLPFAAPKAVTQREATTSLN